MATPPLPPAVRALEAHYRSALRDLFERLEIQGLTPGGPARGPRLEEVYIALKAVAEMPAAEDSSGPEHRDGSSVEQERTLDGLRYRRWREDARHARLRQPPRSVESLVEEMPQPALVLLGEPGSGKSTLLRYLALRATGSERLPIFVPLAAYDECLRQAPLPLEEFLSIYPAKWRGLPGLGPVFQAALEQGRALVLLDGLDEVLEIETRRRVAGQVQALVARWGEAGNRFVLTSRFIGYREARLPTDVPHYMVADFEPLEVERFVRQWYGALERETAEARARDLLEELRDRPALAHLTTHPLLLTMLAVMRGDERPLPTRRIELYARYVDWLVEGWRRQRSAGARRAEERASDDLHTRLMDVALWLHRHRPGGTASPADLVRALRQSAPLDEQEALRCLHELKDLSGLLGERGQDAYGFVHLTFQEYFVGRALARLSPEARWELLRPHVRDPRWHEPLLLCAAWLGTVEGTPERVEALLDTLLANGGELEDVLHRDLLLAVAVLAEDIPLSERLCGQLLSRLEALKSSPVPGLRQSALAGVVHLLRLGYAPAEQRLLVWLGEKQKSASLQEVLQALEEGSLGALSESLRDTLLGMLEGFEASNKVHQVLAKTGASDARLRQRVCELVEQEDPRIRKSMLVFLLGRWVGRDDRVDRLLLGRLETEDEPTRALIASCLRPLVEGDAPVRRALIQRLREDTSQLVLESVADVLMAVAGTDEAVLQALLGREGESAFMTQQLWALLEARAAEDVRVRQALLRRLESEHEQVRIATCQVLGRWVGRDTQVRQALLGRLEDKDAWVRKAACEALNSWAAGDAQIGQALLGRLEDAQMDVRAAAIVGLSARVESDATVTRALLQCLGDDAAFVRRRASEALRMGSGRRPGLSQDLLPLLAGSGAQRTAAVHALGATARTDARVRQAILDLSGDETECMRTAVVHELGGLAGDDAGVHQALLGLLNDKAAGVRLAVVKALTPLAGADARVRRALLGVFDDPDGMVGRTVTQVLGTVAGGDEQVRQALFGRLDEEHSPAVRHCWEDPDAIVQTLSRVARRDEQVRQYLWGACGHADPGMRSVAARALCASADGDARVHTALLELLTQDKDLEVRHELMAALGTWGMGDARVRTHLLGYLEEEAADMRWEASEVLTKAASRDERMREDLLRYAQDPRHQEWREATHALAEMGCQDPRMGPLLLACLEDGKSVGSSVWRALGQSAVEDARVREALMKRLGEGVMDFELITALRPLVAVDARVRRALFEGLTRENNYTRRLILEALGPLAQQDEQVRHLLREGLAGQDAELRQTAITALGATAASDARVGELLLGHLEEQNVSVRRTVIEALTAAQDQEPVRRALLSRLGDEDERVRTAAVNALRVGAGTDTGVRDALLACLEDKSYLVRQAAARALAPLLEGEGDAEVHRVMLKRLEEMRGSEFVHEWSARVGPDEQVRRAFLGLLEVAHYWDRLDIVQALADSHCDDPAVEAALVPWLGTVSNPQQDFPVVAVREAVARYLAPRASRDERLREQLVSMLRHPRAETRQGAAMTLSAMPDGRLVPTRLILTALLEDRRDAARWRERLEVSRALLNVRDRQTSERAIGCALRALEHGFEPWFDQYQAGRERAAAAEVLGHVAPAYQDERLLERLLRLMREDPQEDVRAAAHHAILRLRAAPAESPEAVAKG